MISGVCGADGQREFAENGPKVDPSMGMKIIEFPMQNERFRGSVGLTDSAKSQKMDLKLTPVWGGQSLKFMRKMTDFGGLWG